jgi:hypothetical protein
MKAVDDETNRAGEYSCPTVISTIWKRGGPDYPGIRATTEVKLPGSGNKKINYSIST